MFRANLDNGRSCAYSDCAAGRRIQSNEAPDTNVTAARPLCKILGLGFGLAFALAPRRSFSMAREGWISPKAATVSRGGTPLVSLMMTALMSLTVAD
jgi:amino acid transporter